MAEPDAPSFEAAESAALNLVAAWQWFQEAPAIITAARKASAYVRDQATLVETLQGHADDLEQRIAQLDAEVNEKAALVQAQRADLAEAAEQHRAAADAELARYVATFDAKRAKIDADFAAYRDGEASSRVSKLNDDIDVLTARRNKLASAVAEQEATLEKATGQIAALRALVQKGA